MANNKGFFKTKRQWSLVKDELLRCYLSPYLNKIINTRKPTLYVDCFAGKGKFDDGQDGSPLTAINCVKDSLDKYCHAHSGADAPEVFMRFIELHHADALSSNIPREQKQRCKVIHGRYEEEIVPLLNKAIETFSGKINVFLYVDPYGIKALNASLFRQLPSVFNSAEILINLNSVGFLREALRIRKIALKENETELLADLEEYDATGISSIQELNDVAGGDYWQSIVDDYKSDIIDIYEAEKLFSAAYKKMLRSAYKYVLDMPIRIKQGNNPKYRMVHATNHPQGCLLMADNVFKRTDYLVVDIQRRGQISLFEQSPDNEYVDMDLLEQKMMLLLDNSNGAMIQLTNLLAEFFDKYGVICSTKHLCTDSDSALKRMEKTGKIEVIRTDSNGNKKDSKAWQERKDLIIKIRKK